MKTGSQHSARRIKPRILVVGSSNTDLIIKVARIPKPGETILGGEFARAAGGKGAKQAVAAARAGGTVTFIARVGCDGNGEQALAGFAAAAISVTRFGAQPSAPTRSEIQTLLTTGKVLPGPKTRRPK